MKSYTVNVEGDKREEAKARGYHAYYANGVTAIEVKTTTKRAARSLVSKFAKVLYIFE